MVERWSRTAARHREDPGVRRQIEGMSPASLDVTFGVDALEDSPRRAAHAALAIVKAFARNQEQDPEPIAPRIAIHSGRALVGYIGEAARLDQDSRQALVAALSALVNTAEPGEIVISTSTAASLERRFALEPRAAGEPPARERIASSATSRAAWDCGEHRVASWAAGRRWKPCGATRAPRSPGAAKSSGLSVARGSASHD